MQHFWVNRLKVTISSFIFEKKAATNMEIYAAVPILLFMPPEKPDSTEKEPKCAKKRW